MSQTDHSVTVFLCLCMPLLIVRKFLFNYATHWTAWSPLPVENRACKLLLCIIEGDKERRVLKKSCHINLLRLVALWSSASHDDHYSLEFQTTFWLGWKTMVELCTFFLTLSLSLSLPPLSPLVSLFLVHFELCVLSQSYFSLSPLVFQTLISHPMFCRLSLSLSLTSHAFFLFFFLCLFLSHLCLFCLLFLHFSSFRLSSSSFFWPKLRLSILLPFRFPQTFHLQIFFLSKIFSISSLISCSCSKVFLWGDLSLLLFHFFVKRSPCCTRPSGIF